VNRIAGFAGWVSKLISASLLVALLCWAETDNEFGFYFGNYYRKPANFYIDGRFACRAPAYDEDSGKHVGCDADASHGKHRIRVEIEGLSPQEVVGEVRHHNDEGVFGHAAGWSGHCSVSDDGVLKCDED